jgi:predicted AAA+ superfamily ATPase
MKIVKSYCPSNKRLSYKRETLRLKTISVFWTSIRIQQMGNNNSSKEVAKTKTQEEEKTPQFFIPVLGIRGGGKSTVIEQMTKLYACSKKSGNIIEQNLKIGSFEFILQEINYTMINSENSHFCARIGRL